MMTMNERVEMAVGFAASVEELDEAGYNPNDRPETLVEADPTDDLPY